MDESGSWGLFHLLCVVLSEPEVDQRTKEVSGLGGMPERRDVGRHLLVISEQHCGRGARQTAVSSRAHALGEWGWGWAGGGKRAQGSLARTVLSVGAA